ncbi:MULTISPECIES: hypothetical protein [Sphingobium]|nr:hypothetical protein [Sphingobium indicum]
MSAASLLLLTGLATSACSYVPQKYHYELIVKVMRDGKSYVGSSVREVIVSRQGGALFSFMASKPYRARLIGEAVVVDLGELGHVFTLLRRAEPGEGLVYDQGCTGDAVTNYIMNYHKKADCSQSPMESADFVKNIGRPILFSGPTTPTSIILQNSDNPYSLKYLDNTFEVEMYISVTDKPYKHKISMLFPWIKNFMGRRFTYNPATGNDYLLATIGGSEFISGGTGE